MPGGAFRRFLEELRRRNVLRTGATYLLGAWLTAQVGALLADTFDAPAWIMRGLIVALALGFPASLLFAWIYEITPAGLQREDEIANDEAARLRSARRFDRALIALLGVALLYFVAERLWLARPSADSGDDTRPVVAVLPFENRSDKPDDRYFVDGIHDDILTQLAKISALRVISRTSVERFRDTRLPIGEIAAQLGATRILEGGVQRAGERVRVTVQLIEAQTDTHLWAETYERELSAVNLFAIQSEISLAIAQELRQTMTSAERARIEAIPTRVTPAWEAFQLGRQRMGTRHVDSLNEARRFLERAIELDPEFALAHALLADVWMLLPQYSDLPWEEGYAHSGAMVKRALELDPDLAEAVTSAASIAEEGGDLVAAEAGYRRAIGLNPNYATAHHWYSGLLSTLGRPSESLREAQAAIALDPLAAPLNVALAGALEDNGRYREALERNRKAIEIEPRMTNAYFNIARLQASAFGRPDEAIATLHALVRISPAYPHYADLALNYFGLTDDATAHRLVERSGPSPDAHLVRAILAQVSGNWPLARESAERALAMQPDNVFAHGTLRNVDLREGRAAAALARYAATWPDLMTAESPVINANNRIPALDMVPLLRAAGENAQAERLLDACERFIGKQARFGGNGYGISDVMIHALRGDTRAALASLRDARQEGFSEGWRYFRDVEPNLASIRQEPEFLAVFAEIEQQMRALRAKMPRHPEDE